MLDIPDNAFIFIALGFGGLVILVYILMRTNLLAPFTMQQKSYINRNPKNANYNSWEKSFLSNMKKLVKSEKEPSYKQNRALNNIIKKHPKGKRASNPKPTKKTQRRSSYTKSKTQVKKSVKVSKTKPGKKVIKNRPARQPKPEPKPIEIRSRQSNPLSKFLNRIPIVKEIPIIKQKPTIEEIEHQEEQAKLRKKVELSQNARERMKENKELYEFWLRYNQQDKLPKGSKMNWLEIASLMKKIKDNSPDYESESGILDELDSGLEYSENLEILERYFDLTTEKEFKQIEIDELTKLKREFLEDYYIAKAEDNPSLAVKDSQERNPPVRRIIPGNVNKRWLKNPFSKTGGDYEGIDDGSDPFYLSDFSDEAIAQEKLTKLPAKNKYENAYLDQGQKTQKHFQLYHNAKERLGKDHKTTQYHFKNYHNSLDKQQDLLDKYRNEI